MWPGPSASPRPVSSPEPKTESALKKIFILLRAQTGHDFSLYKPSTINRRIERRLAVHQIETLDGYLRYLQQTPAEVEALFRDLLIGVTNFFRDPEAFAATREASHPPAFRAKPAGALIRVWVPGCSTGEEAYSLAMLLQEHMEALKQSYKVQVFATDIDSQAINTARAGLYPASIVADVPPERLARFFIQEADGGSFRVHKGIRDLLVFSEQDVIKDPPFSKLDLLSCRNLLIYMSGELQKKIIPLFHYALNPGGFLFLGTSETVGEFVDLFSAAGSQIEALSTQRRDLPAPTVRRWVGFLRSRQKRAFYRLWERRPEKASFLCAELTERALLQQYLPVGALVNERGDILYLHGRTGRYLEPTSGEVGINNILKMAREGLRRELTASLTQAVKRKETVRRTGLRVKTNGDFITVQVTVQPVAADPGCSPDRRADRGRPGG